MISRIGSSPLARGLRRRGRGWSVLIGDHPRSRGVYYIIYHHNHLSSGSSPLARGLLRHLSHSHRQFRIIPARAGFTPASRPHGGRTADHPRSRGVYCQWVDTMTSGPGSSPLARGLRSATSPSRRWRRIIPARAGFTGASQPALVKAKDHPRSRGVYSGLDVYFHNLRGSSPLARGLP